MKNSAKCLSAVKNPVMNLQKGSHTKSERLTINWKMAGTWMLSLFLSTEGRGRNFSRNAVVDLPIYTVSNPKIRDSFVSSSCDADSVSRNVSNYILRALLLTNFQSEGMPQ
jgi:hypothetical protein